MLGKGGKKQISKRDTCFYIHFQRLFKNKVFRSVALVKSYGLFFTQTGRFFPLCTLPYKLKKIFFNPSNYFSFKVTKFDGDSVKNESARRK